MSNKSSTDLESWASLFQPDILASAQYYERIRSPKGMEPERRLMLAMVEDAIGCFQRDLFSSPRIATNRFQEAEHWLFGEENGWPFSFENICTFLGLNPAYIRRGLRNWRLGALSADGQKRRFYICTTNQIRRVPKPTGNRPFKGQSKRRDTTPTGG